MSSDPLLPPGSEPEPTIPPQSVPIAPVTPLSPVTGAEANSTGLAPNLAAGLSVLTGIIGGIVFIILEKRDRFVRFWAMQSIFFGAALFAFSIAVNIFLFILAHIIGYLLAHLLGLVFNIVYLGFLAVWIIMLIQSFSGKEWEIPVLGKMAREQLARMPTL